MCDMQTKHVLDMKRDVRYADSTFARHEVEMCDMQTPHVLDMKWECAICRLNMC